MPVSIDDLLTFLGMRVQAQRTVVENDLLPAPDGLKNLLNEDSDGITETCASYYKSGDQDDRFKISRTVVKRLIALMYWCKDMHRVNEIIEFEDGTTVDEILDEINEATIRQDCRKSIKKVRRIVGNELFCV